MDDNKQTITLKLELTERETMALAQMCKRAYSDRLRPFANAFDNDRELNNMTRAVSELQYALATHGYSPR